MGPAPHRTPQPPASASGALVSTPHPGTRRSLTPLSRPRQLPLAQAPGPAGSGSHAPVPPHCPHGGGPHQAPRHSAVGPPACLLHTRDTGRCRGWAVLGVGSAGPPLWPSLRSYEDLSPTLKLPHPSSLSPSVPGVRCVWRGSLCLTGSPRAQTSPACDLRTPGDCCPRSRSSLRVRLSGGVWQGAGLLADWSSL